MTNRESSRRGADLAHLPALGALAWGALAFGAVYPWAYWPLAALCIVAGVVGLVTGSRHHVDGTSRTFAFALIATAAAIGLQLVPLPGSLAAAISPHSRAIVERLSPAFAAGL